MDDKLAKILDGYQQLDQKLAEFVDKSDLSQLTKDNQDLLAKIKHDEQAITELKIRLNQSQTENKKYKNAFIARLLNEKVTLLKYNQARLDRLIVRNVNPNQNKLTALARETRATLNKLNSDQKLQENEAYQPLKTQLKQLQASIQTAQNQLTTAQKATQAQLLKKNEAVHQELAAEPIPKETVKEEVNKSQFESLLGLKGFNYLGIFFIFLAVITFGFLAARSLNHMIPLIVKGLSLFCLPVLSFIGGDYLRKKHKKYFGMGLIGASIGLYYISIFINVLLLHTISSIVGLLLMGLATILSIIGTYHYKSFSIALITMVGGYLPVVSYWSLMGVSTVSMYIIEAYVLFLNIFAISVFEKFKWRSYLSLSFSLFTIFLLSCTLVNQQSLLTELIYIIAYLVIFNGPIYYKLKKQQNKVLMQNWIALGSTFIGSELMISLAAIQSTNKWLQTGVIVFATALMLADLILFRRLSDNDSKSPILVAGWILFNLSLLESIFTIPSLLFENPIYAIVIALGIVLLIYTLFLIKQPSNMLYRFSVNFHLLMMYLFTLSISFNFSMYLIAFGLLVAQYLLATFKDSRLSKVELVYQNITAYTFIIFTTFVTTFHFRIFNFWIIILILLGELWLADYWKNFRKLFLPIITYLVVILLTMISSANPIHTGMNAALALVVNGIVLFLGFNFYRKLVYPKFHRWTWGIICLTSFFLIDADLLAYINIKFDYLTLMMDVLYGITAFLFIIYGLKRADALIRKIGITVLLIDMFKMLIFDVPTSTLVQKLFTFIAFGVIALSVSYLYQAAINKIDDSNDDKKQD